MSVPSHKTIRSTVLLVDGEANVTTHQILAHGVVRVLWDFSVPSSMHTCDSLRLATNTDSQST
jgi:hypothetical protein